ncbi:hypothetical protein K435DRAFT_970156 [Dendrothele bispora CBS 962.96]|uniref:Protein kinase domain-containing protein n=1 Tax=Dendrothele bispora (strain CBS 962.96) TaxID=1314807 RepID=A0A4S8LDF6_DENBC|nr:hypothetical protein K435DRAFT_970156 [Dendrothele bispora CBS 962.96]
MIYTMMDAPKSPLEHENSPSQLPSPLPPSLITLFCYVLGKKDPFAVDISSSLMITVDDLKNTIQQEIPNTLKGIDAHDLELFNVSLPNQNDLMIKAKNEIEGKEPLDPTKRLSKIFPDKPREETIHIAVKLPAYADGFNLDQLPVSFKTVLKQREEFLDVNVAKAPVLFPKGKALTFAERQKYSRGAVQCGRPYHEYNPIPPILFNEILHQFAHDLKHGTPTPSDFEHYDTLVETLCQISSSECVRVTACRRSLREIPEFTGLRQTNIAKYVTNGSLLTVEDISPTQFVETIVYFLLECGNDIGATETEPYFQAIIYYQEMVHVARSKRFQEFTNFPAIFLLNFGSYLQAAVAVFNERPNVQVVGPAFSLHSHPSDFYAREAGARLIHGLRKAVVALNTDYEKVFDLSLRDPSARLKISHPWPTSYCENGKRVGFRYRQQFESEYRRVFFATRTDTKDPLFIKFTQQYGEEVHRAAADLGIAPRLLAVEKLPMGWFMVVMDDIRKEYETWDDIGHVEYRGLKGNLVEALKKLHEKGVVHGDIRGSNVMSKKVDRGEVMLVDFDWSGEAEKVNYPSKINMDLARPKSARPDGPIASQHDLEMVDKICW